MNKLFIIRGLPGSGKTTLAKEINAMCHYEADMWFEQFNGGKFDAAKLKEAHAWCLEQTRYAFENYHDAVVANTFTRRWEYAPYLKLAADYNCQVFILIANGNFKSVHDVPQATIDAMRARFEY